MARAVKSEEELAEVRDAMDIILDGFWALVSAYEPGKTEAEIMGLPWNASSRAVRVPDDEHSLSAPMAKPKPRSRSPEIASLRLTTFFSIPRSDGSGCYLGGVFRGPSFADKSVRVRRRWRMLTRSAGSGARINARGRARQQCSSHRRGQICQTRFRARSPLWSQYRRNDARISAIGAKSDVVLQENMIFSLHPQVVDQDGKVCLYTQDTYRIGKSAGECLAMSLGNSSPVRKPRQRVAFLEGC